ncbi:GNAT family N-acetyltransferase [Phenylobacterium sp.]|uniref:GNAT family N-acetyltransferase n=1 Tax=Phenylobacterium sp. TaxID=1871053 RepID=UPI002FE3C79F
MKIREATAGDAEALAAIYGHHVLHGFGTFEEEPPDAAEMERRRVAIAERGLPYLVAELGPKILGFAYAGPFRLRAAYRYTVEDSVYVAPEAIGRGVGRATLAAVLDRCEAMGLRQVVAVIGDSQNEASIGLHRALGFQEAGVVRDVGFKLGRWVDIVTMQRPLNGGAATLPDGPGVRLG